MDWEVRERERWTFLHMGFPQLNESIAGKLKHYYVHSNGIKERILKMEAFKSWQMVDWRQKKGTLILTLQDFYCGRLRSILCFLPYFSKKYLKSKNCCTHFAKTAINWISSCRVTSRLTSEELITIIWWAHWRKDSRI